MEWKTVKKILKNVLYGLQTIGLHCREEEMKVTTLEVFEERGTRLGDLASLVG